MAGDVFDERMQDSEQRDSASAAARAEIGDEVPHVVHGVAFEELEVCGLTRRLAHAFAWHRGTGSEETLAKRGSVVLAADTREVTAH